MGLAAKLRIVQSKRERCTSDEHNETYLVPESMVLFLQTYAFIPLHNRVDVVRVRSWSAAFCLK